MDGDVELSTSMVKAEWIGIRARHSPRNLNSNRSDVDAYTRRRWSGPQGRPGPA